MLILGVLLRLPNREEERDSAGVEDSYFGVKSDERRERSVMQIAFHQLMHPRHYDHRNDIFKTFNNNVTSDAFNRPLS